VTDHVYYKYSEAACQLDIAGYYTVVLKFYCCRWFETVAWQRETCLDCRKQTFERRQTL